MPLPRWLARMNRRVFSPMEMKRGRRPVLVHVGRKTGSIYLTPLDAHVVDGGYVFILNYGSRSDWVKNLLAAGGGSLQIGAEEVGLTSPRLISEEEAWKALPATTKRPPRFMNVTEYLRTDTEQITG